MPGPAWRLQLFGAPQLVHSAAAAPLPLSRKDAALLALIALASPLPTARAAALLWPQATAAGAVNNLRQRLHRLRRDTAARLVESADSLALAPDLAGLQLPTRDALAADPTAWDGELLGAHDYDDHPDFAAWLHQQREAWAARRSEALAALADEAEGQADWPRALRHAQRLLQEEPLAEHAHRRLMRLHYLRGDRAAAVAAFELCEQRLKHELSLKPSAETLALLGQVERLAPVALPARTVPPSLSRPPRMVGRDAEVAAVAAAAQARQVVLVLGEAGLGKTRLMEELLAQRPGLVYARARPGDAGVPWAVLTRLLGELLRRHGDAAGAAQRPLLARMLPELGPAAPGEGEAQRVLLLRAIEQWLAAAQAGGLAGLVVDDLHFADRASLEGLRALVDAEPSPAWLLAQRPEELAGGAAPPLQPLLDLPGLAVVRLLPLAQPALAELLASLALPGLDAQALAAPLLRRTGGNPLFVLETLRDLLVRGASLGEGGAGGRPETVQRLIERRLHSLSADALALARVAAVAGADLSVPLAEQVLRSSALRLADAWRELEEAQLLRELRFAHDLAHEATLRTLPEAIARVVHGQVAAFLEGQSADPARLAWHWRQAGEPARAGPCFLAAADRARRVGRSDDEAELLDHAVAALAQAGLAAEAFDARCARANAWALSRGVAWADAEVASLVAQAQGDGQRLAALRVRTETLLYAKDAAAAVPAADAFHTLAQRAGDARTRALAAAYAAQALSLVGRHGEALPRLEAARAWVDAEGDAGLRFRFFSVLAFARFNTGALAEAEAAALAAEQAAREANDLGGLHEATSNLAMVQQALGRAGVAVEVARRAASLSEALGLAQVQRTMDMLNLGMCSLGAGRYADAVHALEACVADEATPAPLRVHARSVLALAWTHLAQPARVHQALGGEPLPEGLPPTVAALRLLLLRGGLVAPEEVDDSRLPALEAAVHSLGNGLVGGMLALALARRAGWGPLLETARDLALSREASLPPLAGLARVAWVEALVATGQHDAGREQAARALQALRGLSYMAVYRPQLWWRLRSAALALDAPALAAQAQADALQWLTGEVLPALPDAWRPAFVERNPVNRALLAAARAG
jgi:DNA-binding SARP family transcriptional activator